MEVSRRRLTVPYGSRFLSFLPIGVGELHASPMQTGSHGWVPARRLLCLEVSISMLSTVSRPHAPKAIVLAEHWRRYRRDGEREVRDQLVLAYSPIVKHVAGRIASRMPPHVDLADLVAYGLAGLIEAVERYDPARGVKFESFAGLRIRGAIID